MEKKLDLEAEVICDFEVTQERKKIWQKELDILEKIINICDKNNLRYSISGGTMIGAIRHKGFIPWDDDIDLWMPYDDYERFLNIAKNELEKPYFVQYYKTEKLYDRGHAQIRNSNTTAILKNENNTFNKGIFVDIFPLHNLPDDEKERSAFIKKVIRKKKIIEMNAADENNVIKKFLKNIILKLMNKQKQINSFEKLLTQYDCIQTKYCGSIGFIPNEKFENAWFEKFIDLDFEYLKVKCISNYDEYLSLKYGNYMEIPKNKNASMHGEVLFDTEKSYIDYEKQCKKGEK